VNLLPSLAVFWGLQVLAYVAFKWGSLGGQRNARRWWTGFVVGNVFGTTSTYFLMLVFEKMPHNPNLALVIAMVGSTLGSQLALAVVFRSRLSWIQWAGILLAVVGTAVATVGGRG
jgi:drug/metabolite transporter (DMT)-like permease